MTLTKTEPATLTVDEVRTAIASFDAPMLLRLEAAAKRFADGRGIDPDELLHDAVLNCLLERSCPRHVSVAVFLWQAMRSLASSALKKKRNSKIDRTVDLHDEGTAVGPDDRGSSAEDELLDEERANQLANALDDLFPDDPEAQLVVAGLCQEMTPAEIQRECQLTEKAYNTIRRRIRRKYNKRYPEGWKP